MIVSLNEVKGLKTFLLGDVGCAKDFRFFALLRMTDLGQGTKVERPLLSCAVDSRFRGNDDECSRDWVGNGAPGRIRTRNPWVRSPVLCPLSYGRSRGFIARKVGASDGGRTRDLLCHRQAP